MPNWCMNSLTLEHKDSSMIERAIVGFRQGKLFSEFVPCPEELMETTAMTGDSEQEKSNKEKYGYTSWYDFNVDKWGTKWDVGGADEFIEKNSENEIQLEFDTAWNPPIEMYNKMQELGFTVKAYYFEPGVGLAGSYVDGDNDEHDVSDMSADKIREELPELDSMFGISEMMDFNEDSNEES